MLQQKTFVSPEHGLIVSTPSLLRMTVVKARLFKVDGRIHLLDARQFTGLARCKRPTCIQKTSASLSSGGKGVAINTHGSLKSFTEGVLLACVRESRRVESAIEKDTSNRAVLAHL